jgi:DNA modification methylase
MGVGCPEYVLLFRKLPTDTTKAYADTPVKKSKQEYSRGRWQLDAHAFWRSSGDRLISKEELEHIPVKDLQKVYSKYSKQHVYSYEEHVKLAETLDEQGRLPATFMVIAPAAMTDTVWDDILRMRTLNAEQRRRDLQLHVCPLQIDIVERLIDRYSNKGDVILDPFGGIGTVPLTAMKMQRYGMAVELNNSYFRDGVGYCKAYEDEISAPTLFDFIDDDVR